jgi:hypothetical protein
MYQVQWLTGRAAAYWHQDLRWKVRLNIWFDNVLEGALCP